jgi:hypothetical protein
MPSGSESKRRNVCSTCDATAPAVKTGGTLGTLGWRMRLVKPKSGGLPGTIEWVCPECWEESTGSPPLSGERTKG